MHRQTCTILPHHPVKKELATTPIRIVYDCSCKGDNNSASLTNYLTVGPLRQDNLCSIVMCFRLHRFSLSTDIEKAFFHIMLHPLDRDFTRFLQLISSENFDELQTYQFVVVPYGASSSPFMLGAALDLHLSKFYNEVARDMRVTFMLTTFYQAITLKKTFLCTAKNLRL